MLLSLVRPLRDKHNSHVRWADQPNGDLIIFVPGFLGNALSTWVQFPQLLSRDTVKNADVFFFGHNGGRSQLPSIVGLLSALIDKLWDNPGSFHPLPDARPDDFGYRRLFLCGHSMGCVVIRDAVLAAAEQKKVWAKHVSMLMFAPAHKGIVATLLLAENFAKAQGVIGQWASAAFRYRYPAVDDLRPNCPFLKSLEDRTTSLVKDLPEFSMNVLPRLIVFGEMDKVVTLERFSLDPYPPIILPEQNHTTVCKPLAGKFERPYELMAQALL